MSAARDFAADRKEMLDRSTLGCDFWSNQEELASAWLRAIGRALILLSDSQLSFAIPPSSRSLGSSFFTINTITSETGAQSQ